MPDVHIHVNGGVACEVHPDFHILHSLVWKGVRYDEQMLFILFYETVLNIIFGRIGIVTKGVANRTVQIDVVRYLLPRGRIAVDISFLAGIGPSQRISDGRTCLPERIALRGSCYIIVCNSERLRLGFQDLQTNALLAVSPQNDVCNLLGSGMFRDGVRDYVDVAVVAIVDRHGTGGIPGQDAVGGREIIRVGIQRAVGDGGIDGVNLVAVQGEDARLRIGIHHRNLVVLPFDRAAGFRNPGIRIVPVAHGNNDGRSISLRRCGRPREGVAVRGKAETHVTVRGTVLRAGAEACIKGHAGRILRGETGYSRGRVRREVAENGRVKGEIAESPFRLSARGQFPVAQISRVETDSNGNLGGGPRQGDGVGDRYVFAVRIERGGE